MIESFQGAYNAIKGGLDIAQGFQALKTEAAVNQAVIDIQRGFLEAQRALNEAETRHSTDLRSIAELEQEIVRLKDWEAERQCYELRQIDSSAFAYMHKPGMEQGEPAHWLCTQCFNAGHKSILQSYETGGNQRGGAQTRHRCSRCNAVVSLFYRRRPEVPYVSGAGA